ncbi:MAG: CHAP domain-containing protein [Lachnospiraceae bacterium]|nr:CHAP domain-containing protein [Lachnospiraceae bacterium]
MGHYTGTKSVLFYILATEAPKKDDDDNGNGNETGDQKDTGVQRSAMINQARAWLGKNEGDGSFKDIIDVYNGHTPLAKGYKMSYTDSWCAAFVSALAIKCGLTDILPTECSCERMINLYKNLSAWVENDAYIPLVGDLIFYDWGDDGQGDNTGWSDHVGIIESVVGNVLTVIEGNSSDMVKRRTVNINGKFIRGFATPFYKY